MSGVISMLKAVEQLVSGERTKVGNHSKKFLMNNPNWEDFYYYNTCICSVNHETKDFKTDTGGGRYTSSTIKVINDYRKHFKGLGYNDLNESEK